MDLDLITPNIGYLFLMAGFFLAIMALASPGTGVFELLTLFAFLLAGWFIYTLPTNEWALIVLLLGVVPFVMVLRGKRRSTYLVFAIVGLVVGSAFLFRGEGWRPAVDPLLSLVVSSLMSIFLWIMVTKTLEANASLPDHDLMRLIGATGEAKTDIDDEGSVHVDGELWSARSHKPIPEGARIRVVGREGFVLDVEPVSEEPGHPAALNQVK
jgi:membrane-bound serine protease (ClpP class)